MLMSLFLFSFIRPWRTNGDIAFCFCKSNLSMNSFLHPGSHWRLFSSVNHFQPFFSQKSSSFDKLIVFLLSCGIFIDIAFARFLPHQFITLPNLLTAVISPIFPPDLIVLSDAVTIIGIVEFTFACSSLNGEWHFSLNLFEGSCGQVRTLIKRRSVPFQASTHKRGCWWLTIEESRGKSEKSF